MTTAPSASTAAIAPAASSSGAGNGSKFAMQAHTTHGHHGHKFLMSLEAFLKILEEVMLGSVISPKNASKSYNNAQALSSSSATSATSVATA